MLANSKVPEQRVRKYRKRPTLSCLNCRGRKVKCDRGIPCLNCRKRSVSCQYEKGLASPVENTVSGLSEVPSSVSPSVLSPESLSASGHFVSRSTYSGQNPLGGLKDTINFYEKGPLKNPVISENFGKRGPLGWDFMEINDPGLNVLLTERHQKGRLFLTMKSEWQSEIYKIETKKSGIDDVIGKPSMALGSRLVQYFSSQKLISVYLDVYFEAIYPIMGHVDRSTFYRNINRIMGPLSMVEAPIQKFCLRDRNDLAHVGILLVMLRAGYLAMSPLHKDGKFKPHSEELSLVDRDYIRSHPVKLDAITLAEECFEKLGSLFKPTFEALQFATYIQSYQRYAPEFGEPLCGRLYKLSNGMIFQMACELGLNRDPDSDDSIPAVEKNVRRKIWLSLMLEDVVDAYSFGSPVHSDTLFYDTKSPHHFVKHGPEVQMYQLMEEYSFKFREILRVLLNMTGNTPVRELCSMLNSFELYLDGKIGNVHDLYKAEVYSNDKWHTCGLVKLWSSSKIFFLSVYGHLALYYESRGNNDEYLFFYMRKIFAISSLDFMPILYAIITDSGTGYSTLSEFLVVPYLLQLTHGVSSSICSVLLRLRFLSFRNPPHAELIQKLIEKIKQLTGVIIQVVNSCSRKYRYAWNISKQFGDCMELTCDDTFFERHAAEVENHIRYKIFTKEHLEELISIADVSLERINQLRRQKQKSADAKEALEVEENWSRPEGFMFQPIEDASIDELWSNLLADKQELNVLFDF